MSGGETEYGDWVVAGRGEILRTVVGSGVHGIAIEGTDDHDEMGVYVEPPEMVMGLRPPPDRYVWRTQPEGARSGPGDTDLVMYSLRKYLRLAAKGNPTALLPLFAPPEAVIVMTPLGAQLREMRDVFLTRQAVERFLGYMHSQHERMLGRGKQNRAPNRPELVEKYGYDTKFAAHALRLAFQGWEVAANARLTLPMLPEWQELLIRVKQGELSRDQVSAWIGEYEDATRRRLDVGPCRLPAEPDWDRLSEWSVAAHREHWNWTAT